MANFIREKRTYCGKNYLEVDIYSCNDSQKIKRAKRKKESLPAQKNLNDKNARRKFIQFAETNFSSEDISLTLTYNNEFLPDSQEEAEKEAYNYLRRLKRLMSKKGIELRYMMVTSCTNKNDEKTGKEKPIRIHHHILINGGVDRDEMEGLWRKKIGKEYKSMGYANADRIQVDANTGIERLANYLMGNKTNKRRWTCSQNLKKPESVTSDSRYSRRQVKRIVMEQKDVEYWERKYQGYTITDKVAGYEVDYNDFTGWSIHLKMRRKI